MHSHTFSWRYLGFVAAFLAVILSLFLFPRSEQVRSIETERSLTVAGETIRVAVADAPAERERGLSGTERLASGEGMLFVFPAEGRHSFWMKDMHYAIDILWISSEKRVVYLEKDVAPGTFPQTFTPDTPARYVLEVPAGFAASHGIGEGSEVRF